MASNLPLVYILILTFNNCKDTTQVITSLKKMSYRNFQIVIVDNHSTDETVSVLRESYPDIHLLLNPKNLGFSAGINVGIRYALKNKTDFVLLLNNDVLVDVMMLTHLVNAMASDIGAASPLIYYLDEPNKIWSDGFFRDKLFLEMKGGRRNQVEFNSKDAPFDVDYLLGCAILIDTAIFDQVGLFDERYFFYYEDLDLSLRIKQFGYRLITVPQSKMWHKVSGTAGAGSTFRTYHMAKGSVIFSRKHASGLQKVAVFFLRLGSTLKKSFVFLVNKQLSHFCYYWQGLWDGWLAS